MTGLFNNPRRRLRTLVKKKKYDEALEYGHGIEKGLEHDPDIAFIIGTIYYIKGDPEKTLEYMDCLLYTSPSPRDRTRSRMPSSA